MLCADRDETCCLQGQQAPGVAGNGGDDAVAGHIETGDGEWVSAHPYLSSASPKIRSRRGSGMCGNGHRGSCRNHPRAVPVICYAVDKLADHGETND